MEQRTKVRLTKPANTLDGPKEPGHEIDHPDAHYLVKLGIAEWVEESPPPAEDSGDQQNETDDEPADEDDPFAAPDRPRVAEAATDVEVDPPTEL